MLHTLLNIQQLLTQLAVQDSFFTLLTFNNYLKELYIRNSNTCIF